MPWQLIEGAPKTDNQQLLLYGPQDGIDIGFYDKSSGVWLHAADGLLLDPTHWQYLPDPPNEDAEED